MNPRARTVFSLLLASSFASLIASTAFPAETTKIIAVASINDHCVFESTAAVIPSLRDRVVSDLVRKYDCVVLSRAKGVSLAEEHALHGMADVIESPAKRAATVFVPAADYALTGFCELRDSAATRARVRLILSDLRDTSAEFVQSDVNFDYWQTSDAITHRVAETWHLTPRAASPAETSPDVRDETWTVLPCQRFDRGDLRSNLTDRVLSQWVEVVLQDSGRLKRLVDHNELDRMIQEAQMSLVGFANPGMAGEVARLVGADKVVMGTVSRSGIGPNPGLVRLDLLLVDGRNGVVVDAASAIDSAAQIHQLASDCSFSLLQSSWTCPPLEAAPKAQRLREARLHAERADKAFAAYGNFRPWLRFQEVLEDVEAAAYVGYDDDALIYRTFTRMQSFLVNVWRGYGGIDELPSDQRALAVSIAEARLLRMPCTSDTDAPLLKLAELAQWMGQFDKAAQLVNRHLAQHPNQNTGYAEIVLGIMLYRQGDYRGALSHLRKGSPTSGRYLFESECCAQLSDEEGELDALRHAQASGVFHAEHLLAARYIELMRKRNGAQAALDAVAGLDRWVRTWPCLQVEEAKTLLALGRQDEAASMLRRLSEAPHQWSQTAEGTAQRSRYERKMRELEPVYRNATAEWKTLVEIGAGIPAKYKVYLRPVGGIDVEALRKAAVECAAFLGCQVNVLPQVPLPRNDPGCFNVDRGQYQVYSLLSRLNYACTNPPDALLVVNCTSADIYSGRLRYVWGLNSIEQGSVISSRRWNLRRDRARLAHTFAVAACWQVVGRLAATAQMESISDRPHWLGCDHPPCLMAEDGGLGVREKKLGLCPACVEGCRHFNYDRSFRLFQEATQKDRMSVPRFQDEAEQYKKSVEEWAKWPPGTNVRIEKMDRGITSPIPTKPDGRWDTTGITFPVQTNRVPARLGLSFGIVCTVGGLPVEQQVRLDWKVSRPVFSGSGEIFSTNNICPDWPTTSDTGEATSHYLFRFDRREEMCPGPWTIALSYGKQTLLDEKLDVYTPLTPDE